MGSKFLNINKLNALAVKGRIEQEKKIANEKKKREEERKRKEEERMKREEERKRREEEREKLRAQKKLKREKLKLYERIKSSGMKITGDMEKDIETYISIIHSSKPKPPKSRKKGHTVSSFPIDSYYDLSPINATVETYNINRKVVPISKGKEKNKSKNKNQSNGMAFDKFEYGLD